MRGPVILALCAVSLLLLAVSAMATRPAFSIGAYSQETGDETAQAGGSITVTSSTPGRSGGPPASGAPGDVVSGAEGGSASGTSAGSQGRVEPLGQGSYRYVGAEGQECLYLTEGIDTCASEEEARPAAPAAPARPAVSPEAVAVTVSDRLDLEVGRILASPSAQTAGLTGAPSWFWLQPAPAARSLSISLRGEQVTVSASAREVLWSFGDGAQLTGGAGVPYRPGAAPAGAVLHTYNTRCLPGDQGHDPNVLASCGAEGYTVAANVVWGISYQASGPVSASGTLPSRTTAGSIAYPVSEARAFLTSANGGGG